MSDHVILDPIGNPRGEHVLRFLDSRVRGNDMTAAHAMTDTNDMTDAAAMQEYAVRQWNHPDWRRWAIYRCPNHENGRLD